MDKTEELNAEGNEVHWADKAAASVIEEFPDEETYVVASGVTPSGIIHIGHFREIITTELVRRALENKGKKTKFIYSWDSYDEFRKVPKDVSKEWSKYIGVPDAMIPDPWGCHESYAHHFMEEMERGTRMLGFPVEFQYQHELYPSGIYAEKIKEALNNVDKIREILDRYRSEPLKKDWFPLVVYCENCNRNSTKVLNYDGGYCIDYECECGHRDEIDFSETSNVKPSWRVDWPMRWNYFKVAFEPGGKDHSTYGGSYMTGCDIISEVWDRKAPTYVFYNFVGMKGEGGKISSSSGGAPTVTKVLEVYTPEVLLFIFAGSRPSAELTLSFDMDVLKIYEDFDYMERVYYGEEVLENQKKLEYYRRIYELSRVDEIPSEMPVQFGFRHLCNIAQAYDFDFEKVKKFYESYIRTDLDLKRLEERFERAKNWLLNYAPEDMRFVLNEVLPSNIKSELSESQMEGLRKLRDYLKSEEYDADELKSKFKEISDNVGLKPKEFFEGAYLVIMNKRKGPRLNNFVRDMRERVIYILEQL